MMSSVGINMTNGHFVLQKDASLAKADALGSRIVNSIITRIIRV